MTRLIATTVLIATLAMTSVASAAHLKFEAALSGAEEVPPVATDGTGTAKFGVHANRVIFRLRWEGLTTPAMAAHIHCGETGENGPVGVTLFAGAMGTKGHVNGRFTAPDPANACGWADLSDVIEAMSSGATYVNVHTQMFPGGEIRGQVSAD